MLPRYTIYNILASFLYLYVHFLQFNQHNLRLQYLLVKEINHFLSKFHYCYINICQNILSIRQAQSLIAKYTFSR